MTKPPRCLAAALCSLLALLVSNSSAGQSGPDCWEVWAARPPLAPRCGFDSATARWTIEGDGQAGRHGGWDLHWSRVEPDRWYRFEVVCEARDVPSLRDNAHAELIFWQIDTRRAGWCHVDLEQRADGAFLFHCLTRLPAGTRKVTARLMLRWTDRGELVWRDARLVPGEPPAERKIKTAIVTGKPPGTSVADNLAFAEKLIRAAAGKGARVICLPEVILSWRVKNEPDEGARPIPGPETRQLETLARELDVDVVFSMYELDADRLIYNTGVYLEARAGIAGTYRKVHLSVGERWRGITPGNEFPVWSTRYGKAGMLICYDNVHPEGHRILSQKGAEVIFLPIMGDPRAIGERAYEKWLQIMSVRAMDNQVWMVVCQNNGDRGVIVRPDGEVIAAVDSGTGFAMAEMDLNFRWQSTIGSDFRNRVRGERRPHLYGDLLQDR